MLGGVDGVVDRVVESQGYLGYGWRICWGMWDVMCRCGGSLRDTWDTAGGYIGACVLTCVPVGGVSGILGLQLADILGHVY